VLPFSVTWIGWKSPPEAEDLCLLPNGLVNAPVPGQGSQLLGFLALELQAAGPIIPAPQHPGGNVLARVAAEIFPHVSQLAQGQGPGDDHGLYLPR